MLFVNEIPKLAGEKRTWTDNVKQDVTKDEGSLCRLQTFFLDSWIINYAALALSIASLIGVSYILHTYNGLPLFAWRHSLSFNAVLSLVATVIKGSTMLATATALSQSKWIWFHTRKRPLQDFSTFDDASRGPLGAAQLLVRLNMWHLASLGAVVTLLALLSDTFVQASTTFPYEVITVRDSWIPVSTNYTFGLTAVAGHPAGSMNVDPSLMSALYSGVLGDDLPTSPSVITPDCSTGNCTFAPYISLGICAECQNVTTRLRQQPELSSDLLTSSDSTFYLTNNKGADLVTLTQNYTTNSIVGFVNMTTVPGVLTPSSDNTSIILGLSNTSIITSTGFDTSSVFRAFQCSLSLCVREYQASVTGGKLIETVTDVTYTGWNATPSMTRPQLRDLGSLTMNKTMQDGQQASVSFDYLAWSGMISYLGADSVGLKGTVHASPGPFDGSGTDVNLTVQDAYGNYDGYTYFTNDFVKGFWSYANTPDPDVPHIWDNIASTVTANMRVRSGNRARGTAQARTPYIIVRWEFMILTTVMVLLAVVFVVLTRWRSRLCDLPTWGSNALADVAYAGGMALDISTGDNSSPTERPEIMLKTSDLQAWAEEKEARLRFRELGNYGWV